MRNLTQEAIKLAEDAIIQANPSLADKQLREQLPPQLKTTIIMQLDVLYEAYMVQLLSEFEPSHANVVY